MKRMWVAAAAAVLLVTGCAVAEESEPTDQEPQSSTQMIASEPVTETPIPEAPVTEPPEAAIAPTSPGEVCDPGNANDSICAAFYPDIAAENIVNRQPLLAGTPAAELEVAMTQACAALQTGNTASKAAVHPDRAANNALFAAAAFSTCPEHLGTESPYAAWLVDQYTQMGEEAAASQFATGSMPDGAKEKLIEFSGIPQA